jgi:hypothetical protein
VFDRIGSYRVYCSFSQFIGKIGRYSSVEDFTVHISNQMDFGRFLPVFTEFDRFFQKLTESEGANFFVSASFLNTDNSPSSNIQYSSREIYREEPWTKT